MVKPNCGKCGKTMTPENSTAAPEYFLCDDCAIEVGLKPRRRIDPQARIKELLEAIEEKPSKERISVKTSTERLVSDLSMINPPCPNDVIRFSNGERWQLAFTSTNGILLHVPDKRLDYHPCHFEGDTLHGPDSMESLLDLLLNVVDRHSVDCDCFDRWIDKPCNCQCDHLCNDYLEFGSCRCTRALEQQTRLAG